MHQERYCAAWLGVLAGNQVARPHTVAVIVAVHLEVAVVSHVLTVESVVLWVLAELGVVDGAYHAC